MGSPDSEFWDEYEELKNELGNMTYDEYEYCREVEEYGSTNEELGLDDEDDEWF